MNTEELVELFAHKSFKRLEQHKTHWEIVHISFDGVSIASLCDKHLDRLVEIYKGVTQSIDSASEGDHEHEHYFTRSWDDGTLVCKCGAWK